MAPHAETLSDEDPPAIEPYIVLGIAKDASADEVKIAYRKAALKHHPGMVLFHSFHLAILLNSSSIFKAVQELSK